MTGRTAENAPLDPLAYDPLPSDIRVAIGAVLHGVVPDRYGYADGLNKDDALAFAAHLAQWVESQSFDLYGGRLLSDRNRLYQEAGRLRVAVEVAQPAVQILLDKCISDDVRAVVQQALDVIDAALTDASSSVDADGIPTEGDGS